MLVKVLLNVGVNFREKHGCGGGGKGSGQGILTINVLKMCCFVFFFFLNVTSIHNSYDACYF